MTFAQWIDTAEPDYDFATNDDLERHMASAPAPRKPRDPFDDAHDAAHPQSDAAGNFVLPVSPFELPNGGAR